MLNVSSNKHYAAKTVPKVRYCYVNFYICDIYKKNNGISAR